MLKPRCPAPSGLSSVLGAPRHRLADLTLVGQKLGADRHRIGLAAGLEGPEACGELRDLTPGVGPALVEAHTPRRQASTSSSLVGERHASADPWGASARPTGYAGGDC